MESRPLSEKNQITTVKIEAEKKKINHEQTRGIIRIPIRKAFKKANESTSNASLPNNSPKKTSNQYQSKKSSSFAPKYKTKPEMSYDVQYSNWLEEQNEFLMKQVRFLQNTVYFWTNENMQLRNHVQNLQNKLEQKEREIEEYKDVLDEMPFIFREFLIEKLTNDLNYSKNL
jgi:hypothetical protein